MPKKRKPSYGLHKATGQARVWIDGQDHYLGPYGSPESRDRYDDLIAEWFAKNGDVSGHTMTVADLALCFMQHAERYYVKDGKPTCEVNNIRIALRPVIRLFANCRARDFSPRKLKDVRQVMVDAGCVRTSINRQVGRIKRMFRWAVENEYVSADVYTAISTVAGLRAGRSDAVESDPVKPVPAAFVNAIEPHVTRQIWGMIQVQQFAGTRPGEITAMRGCDLNMTGDVWEYVPKSHKTEHHGKARMIFIGPRAQAVLRGFLKTDLQAFLFSPAEARREFDERRKANRKSPMTPSQRARKRKADPKKQPGERYTTASYGYAIRKACKLAGVPNWSPNQLRHNAGTEVRRGFGIEAARTVLGHSSAATSEIYAELDYAKARDIMGQIG
jgi:integrase